MKPIAIYTLTSQLHDKQAVTADTQQFLASLNIDHELCDDRYDDYGSHTLSLLFVRTGGTEGIFKSLLGKLTERSLRPFYLLTSGRSNSLAASMEILSYLQQHGLKGEIIHGSPAYISGRIQLLLSVERAVRQLNGCRLGIIGQPSDWLIASHSDAGQVLKTAGITLTDIPMQQLLDAIAATAERTPAETSQRADISKALPGANRIYDALKHIVETNGLQGFTLRCFDLLSAIGNTGCLALAKLNAEGYVAGCEGDVPAMLSMMIVRSLLGISGFQANPSAIDPDKGQMLFAHCTIPLDMVDSYEFDTHFESGIGVAIRGHMKEGPVTIFKVSGLLDRHFAAEGTLERCQAEAGLCRTQQVIRLADKQQAAYFLTRPIGNHHIIMPGHHRALIEQLMASLSPVDKC